MRIHYLGHASFVLRFENGVSVLMDYGISNAYGLASPVCDISGVDPSIVTFSHDHPDHRRPGLSFSGSRVLEGGGGLSLDGLTIESIGTCEASMERADNASFVINFEGFRILHLADAQSFISAIYDPVVKRRVKDKYPDSYDLVFLTIDGSSEMTEQAATFLDVLAPARAIPMHYWTADTKADFLRAVHTLNRVGRGRPGRFTIAEPGGSDFSLYADSPPYGTRVISLEPAPLELCPEDSRALDPEASAETTEPAIPVHSGAPYRTPAPAPARLPIPRSGQGPVPAAASHGSPAWRHVAPINPPARRPSVGTSSAQGFAAPAAPPARRVSSPPAPSRVRTSTALHPGRDLG